MTKSLLWVSFASSILSVHHGYFIWIVYSPGVLLREYYNPITFQVITHPKFKLLELAIIVSIIPLGGFILCIVPLYVGEIAPRKYRGVIIFVHQFCLNIGILIAQVLAIKEILGNSTGLPALMALGGIIPLIQLFLLPFIPETPRYLMIHKKNEQQARKVLKMLRETDDVEDEIIELYQEDLAENNNKDMTPLKLIRTPNMRLQIITIVVVVAGAQLSGISLAYFSTERIFLMMIDRSNLKYLNSGAIIIMTCSVLLGMYLVDSVGRRPLLLASFAAPLPHLLILEMFSQSSRASAFVISGSVFWSISFITGLSFYYIEIEFGNYSSMLFWPFCIATLVYIYKMIPETMMQTFPDIKRVMSIKTARRFRSRESRRKLNSKRSV
ncbi:solute carrier family 2, facilitated glucose transporter member 5-like [Pseudonaja textilis]|uniref:solute carrier family 2, facilitated glucose transporter member 5-like n=1 Tax=Pseudonaja textilis TaxID=8673 RepID=UPI000EA9F687|nr:solute carrier family 2, facilitated glucose transporter member 5-like [Pseudonaja textilis]